MKISIETDNCCGAGQCVLVAPEIFDQDDDGIVILLDPAPSDDAREAVEDAIAICPADVIQLE
ncbi:ferredoxin [Streptomyces incarnatus]|uniref:Ferredoxin n=1 Tax=Streptomyces incarnatus TaxID=665007 RepID=A0ABM5TFK0_9ACTN|nr:ferredoxin [Streptomyces incarnatus]AKJ09706.1 ferredoxin [Streptomyces incarnatus]